ncbi:MAG: DUF721 domain-containing protein [Rhodospirillaceae bacterium]|nr:DUF721 domain-containing protein [Rhodospirillaceae bacterium]
MAQNNRQRGGRAKTLAEHVGKITKPIFGVRGFADAAIINDWPVIAGEHLAAHSAPEKIHYSPGNKDKGVLHLRIDNGGLATYVQHQGDVLIEKINTYFGYAAVERIYINQGPLPERSKTVPPPVPPLPETEERVLLKNLSDIEDEDLHQALEGLGRAVLGKTLKQKP